MCDEAIQQVFRAVVIWRICYVSKTLMHDGGSLLRLPTDNTSRPSFAVQYAAVSVPLNFQTSTNTDETLFRRILANPEHLLSNLIPSVTDTPYSLPIDLRVSSLTAATFARHLKACLFRRPS